MAHIGPNGLPVMWYPPSGWETQMGAGGSSLSLNHPAMFCYPMGYNGPPMLTPYYPGHLSRAHSPARSVKSGRRSRAASPSPSIKSKKSYTSRARSRRSPQGSPSDASSENSEDSDLDDRLSRSSRSIRRSSFSKSRTRVYQDDEKNKTPASHGR